MARKRVRKEDREFYTQVKISGVCLRATSQYVESEEWDEATYTIDLAERHLLHAMKDTQVKLRKRDEQHTD